MSDEEQQVIVNFFRALGDESRLKIVGLLAVGERSVEELAATLRVKPPTVSHHLSKLREAGLVRMRAEGTTHLYALDTDTLRRMNRDLLTPERMASLVADDAGDAFAHKVLRDYFAGELLTQIPTSRKKREVILSWLAERFAPETRYSEKEVNAIIGRHHADTATLRRELVGGGWMGREGGAGAYWRITREGDAVPERTLARVPGEVGMTWAIAHRPRGTETDDRT